MSAHTDAEPQPRPEGHQPAATGAAGEAGSGAPQWDPLVRITHWGVAAAVLLNGLLVEDESLAHIWIGYGALALLALRLLWGFVGTEEARFSAFPPSLPAARQHIGEILGGRVVPHRSHNPLGALMAYALWGTLLVVCATGVMLKSEPFPAARADGIERAGHADGDDDHDRDEARGTGGEVIEEIHEASANLVLLLAALHVAGVAFETRRTGRNIVGPMLLGHAGDER